LKLRQPQTQDPDISLTPLIDVVFLLLIFFMVSTSFNRESEISVDLPVATAQEKESEQTPIDLTIDREGRFYINGKRVINTQVTTLIKALKLVIKDQEQPALLISADGKTPHQAVVTAMDAARTVGITHLSLATKQTPVNPAVSR
jgi:biopolymer transport protein ExbD